MFEKSITMNPSIEARNTIISFDRKILRSKAFDGNQQWGEKHGWMKIDYSRQQNNLEPTLVCPSIQEE